MPEFTFKSELWIPQYTGVKANTLSGFVKALKEVDDDTIYYHFYRNLFEYHFMPTEFSNSFAYWLSENGYPLLAEKVSAIDLLECTCIDDIRREILGILEEYYGNGDKICRPFHFIRAKRWIIETEFVARNVEELIECVEQVSISSLFYHLVGSKLRENSPVNDFARWLAELGFEKKAEAVNRIDLMVMSLYEAKRTILEILRDGDA